MPNQFSVRDAGVSFNDAQFIIDAFDSTIPHLAATGNSEQWGIEPLSNQKGFIQKMHDFLAESEKFRETGAGNPMRIFIAEVHDDQVNQEITASDGLARRVDEKGNTLLSVGLAIVLDNTFVKYLQESDSVKDHIGPAMEKGNFVFLQYLVTDHRVGDRRKGAGTALLEKVKEYAIEHGWKAIWIDCWDGGNGQLVQYYVDRGFQIMGGFVLTHDKDGSKWKGKLLRIDL
ncbi:hypothetical protein F66182_3217 [Fusarium sp. NRRL 66182]|nr:hypothetical protein F66182_3217 [Fusarium sp. NRRL 66182]